MADLRMLRIPTSDGRRPVGAS